MLCPGADMKIVCMMKQACTVLSTGGEAVQYALRSHWSISIGEWRISRLRSRARIEIIRLVFLPKTVETIVCHQA